MKVFRIVWFVAMLIERQTRKSCQKLRSFLLKKYGDERGFFSEIYRSDMKVSLDLESNFIQDNHAFSREAA